MNTKTFTLKQIKKTTDLAEKCIIVVSETRAKNANTWSVFELKTSERIEKALKRREEPLKTGDLLSIPGVEKTDADLFLAVLPEEMTTFNLLGFAGAALKQGLPASAKSLSLVFLEAKEEARLSDCFGAAIATRIFQMPVYGKRVEKLKPFKLKDVFIFSAANQQKNFNYGFETGEGENLVRYLGALPPNELNTITYGAKIKELATKYKFQLKFYSHAELKKMGAGAFTAVDQGNPDSKGGIYELTYSPSKAKNKNAIAFVGKGLCFDTGGYDVKTQGYMIGMKADMTGSALALSNMMTAARLKWPLKMKAFLGVTENHISPKAYKADEVVIALNGMSIEVINTDAEGRMVLADTLTLASRAKPEMIIDYATLTGSATIAIGTSYSAGFTNREELHSRIIKSGKISGERVWPFPLDKDFGKTLESPIADMIQCAPKRSPDHILAAYFLSQFVDKDIPWVHIDLSSAEHTGGLAHVESALTGFGVRWTMEFLKASFKI
ncbi:MAG: Peptidase [Bacteriovoracaceae bacterium]|nr:Peptidase [Bacteriovoracaceae bacterium]